MSINQKIKLFIAHADTEKDIEHFQAFKNQLSPILERDNIENWYDKKVGAGENRERKILKNLEDADIIILLVSSDFISDPFYGTTILNNAIGRESRNNVKIVPIIIRPCTWDKTELEKYDVLPNRRESVEESPNQDKALVEIVESIASDIKEIRAKEIEELQEQNNVPTINALFAQPIDKDFEYNFDQLFSQVKKFNVKINKFYLSEDSLRTVDESDYLFLFTNVQVGKLYGEDDYMVSKLFELSEVEDNLFSIPKIIFILSDQPLDLEKLGIPAIQVNYKDKSIVKNLLFNTIQRPKVDWVKNNDKVLSNSLLQNLDIVQLQKGRSVINKFDTELLIDKSYVKNFIGRELTLKELTRKIIEIKYDQNNPILTIRGVSGIGKTSLVVKSILEIAKRGHFTDGIHFLDCQHFKNYKMLEGNIAEVFGLDGTIDLKGDLVARGQFDALIILENFESILNIRQEEDGIGIDSEESKNESIKLLQHISNYCKIILISWEILNQNFEEWMEVKPMSLETSVKLFSGYWSGEIQNEEEQKILEDDILTKALDKNPLAIKVVANNIPSGKDMKSLRENLRTNEFAGREQIFNPINFSYQTLQNREKWAFELLSLFPSGISLKEFKECFKENIADTKITDKEFRVLENKSMVEVVNGKYQLQPILRRFALKQFNKKSDENKGPFYLDALRYNNHFIGKIEKYVGKNREEIERNFANGLKSLANGLFDLEGENRIKVLKILPLFGNMIGKYLFKSIYADLVIDFFQKISKISNNEAINLQIEMTKILFIYFFKSLDLGLKLLNELFPLDQFVLKVPNNSIEIFSAYRDAWNIYSIEGYSFVSIQYFWKYKDVFLTNKNFIVFQGQLFQLGVFNFIEFAKSLSSFERDFSLGELNIDNLKLYLSNLPKTNHLKKMQGYYVLAKNIPLDRKTIDRLVIVNKFTKGLKLMIKAFNEKENKDRTELFEEAIGNFDHVKFYHAEGLYYLSKHLKEIKDNSFSKWLSEGENIAQKYHFRYLIHQFKNLREGTEIQYDESDYPLPDNFNIQAVVKRYNSIVEKRNKK